jgi:hypothetical protein
MTQQTVAVFRSPGAYEAAMEAERAERLRRHAAQAVARRNRRPKASLWLRGACTEAERIAFSRQLISAVPAPDDEAKKLARRAVGKAWKPVIFQGGSPGLGRRH